jgi:predicted esterase
MIRIVLILTLGFFLTVIRGPAQQIDYKGFPEWSWQKEGDTEYYLYKPDNINEDKRYPVAVFLHGCCGEDDHATLRNTVDPPVRMWHNFGENSQREPTFIIAPKTTRGWRQKFPDIKKVIDDLISAGMADPQRIYMTGFSMGGAGTWEFMEQYPGFLAAAIPMGMGVTADPEIIKDTPAWAIRGEHDYFAQKLDSQVAVIRKLNGDPRGGLEWVTGVNPLFSSFEGLGHGIQWDAVSTLHLLEWAYNQVNDGNIRPVVYFESPVNNQYFKSGKKAEIRIKTHDPDGSIRDLTLTRNDIIIMRTENEPVQVKVELEEGDNLIEAVVTDNGGKSSKASILIRTDVMPEINTKNLPDGRVADGYSALLSASGNQPVIFRIDEEDLPAGLRLDGNRILGVPEEKGDFSVPLLAVDDDGQQVIQVLPLVIAEKPDDRVRVTAVYSTADSLMNRVSLLYPGELPNLQAGTEVTFSQTGIYEGMTYIATSQDQANLSGENVLNFTVDEDVMVYVAYEKLDNLYSSTIPDWLKEYEHLKNGQIVAQYFYFDVYRKPFPKGRVSLPGAEADRHNVIRNYFVMIKKN